MKSINGFSLLVCALSLGPVWTSAGSAQTRAKAAGPDPVVSIGAGRLRGSLTAEGVAVFKNIPFARPPAGDPRWKEPSPAK